MTEIEKYKLSTYSPGEILRKTSDSSVELVECTLDGKKYIKKTYQADKRAAYRVLAKIQNDCIPKVHEIFFGEDTVVIEEYIEGKTLDELISDKHAFSKAEVEKTVSCLLSAVSALHKSNLIHRDIKPSNIIIKPSGEAVLIDYDIARVYSPKQTGDTEHFGTVGYAAPEQFGFSQSDFRTDIYALGITLKHIVTKKNASKTLISAVNKCAEFDPLRRFQSVDELQEFLGKGKRTKRRIAMLCGVAVLFLAFGLLVFAVKETKVPADTDALLLEPSDCRIVDTTNAGEEVPCLRLAEDRSYFVTVHLGDGADTQIEVVKDGVNIDIVINGEAFSFSDESGLSTACYEGGEPFAEIIFYDMNGDGISEIIPVMTNAKKAQWADGSVVLLKNYSLGWCIYRSEKGFECAVGQMAAIAEPFRIYAAMPSCISADFPSYYTLINGELVLR